MTWTLVIIFTAQLQSTQITVDGFDSYDSCIASAQSVEATLTLTNGWTNSKRTNHIDLTHVYCRKSDDKE